MALVDALSAVTLPDPARRPIRSSVAAISVGLVDERALLDLNYREDVAASVDMNIVMTGDGRFVEVQGTAEGVAVPRAAIDRMVDLGLAGVTSLAKLQARALASAGVELEALMQPARAEEM